MHFYTATDSGLVQFGNARWASCDSVMERNDDLIKEAIVFHSLCAIDFRRKKKSSVAP
jgi:hypothetical protein